MAYENQDSLAELERPLTSKHQQGCIKDSGQEGKLGRTMCRRGEGVSCSHNHHGRGYRSASNAHHRMLHNLECNVQLA